jgi:hypothetical protein
MRSVVLFVALLTAACGSDIPDKSNDRPFNSSDPAFSEYYESFEERHSTKIVDIPIRFGSVGGYGRAACYQMKDGKSYIKVDKVFWTSASDASRQQVIDHELGHCHYKIMTHDNTMLENGMPASIMNANVFNRQQLEHWLDNQNYYINDLIEKGIRHD